MAFQTRQATKQMKLSLHYLGCALVLISGMALVALAQSGSQTGAAKKANSRPAEASSPKPEPFDGASVEKMAASCVSLETELGVIEIEMIPEVAPESVRGFLNLAATGALDTTTLAARSRTLSFKAGISPPVKSGTTIWPGGCRVNFPMNPA